MFMSDTKLFYHANYSNVGQKKSRFKNNTSKYNKLKFYDFIFLLL